MITLLSFVLVAVACERGSADAETVAAPAGVWCLVEPPGFAFKSFAGRVKPSELIAHAKNPREIEYGVFAARGPVTLVR